jgi:hypothetical protein
MLKKTNRESEDKVKIGSGKVRTVFKKIWESVDSAKKTSRKVRAVSVKRIWESEPTWHCKVTSSPSFTLTSEGSVTK